MAKIRYINDFDIVNGFWGTSVSVWFQGCEHRCSSCFNSETWNPNDESVKERNNKDIADEILSKIDKYFSKNLSFLGGDPLATYNIDDLYEIIKLVKKAKPNIKIALWTGYTWEQLINSEKVIRGLKDIDIIVDGKYEEKLKCDYSASKVFNDKKRGSLNQKIIDVKKSLSNGRIILWESE